MIAFQDVAEGTARLTWDTPFTEGELQVAVTEALVTHHRVEALFEPDDHHGHRLAHRVRMHREGRVRGVTVGGVVGDRYLYSRIATDTPAHEPEEFRAVMNDFLPRKRAIGQMLIRDAEDRILLCRTTYKPDWDFPGGVVEVGESPREGVTRELEEELGVSFDAGDLVLVDWLPTWSGWDDGLILLFDGGVHDDGLLQRMELLDGEIGEVAFVRVDQMHELSADFTVRRAEAALRSVHGEGSVFTESGR